MQASRSKRGFTLIELLVVIGIITMLSSIILASLSSARAKSRDATRVSNMKEVELALSVYREANGSYPSTSNVWRSQCAGWGSHPADNVIPGLVPGYLQRIPTDPRMNVVTNQCCYLYVSDGNGYKFLGGYNCPDVNYASQPTLIDPVRDGNYNPAAPLCVLDGSAPHSWASFSAPFDFFGTIVNPCFY